MSIEVTALTKQINTQPVLEEITFSWQLGEIIGLVGRNGVGKTTLMRTLIDQYQPNGGRIEISGADVAKVPARRQDMFYLDTEALFFKRWRLPAIGATMALAYPKFDQALYLALLAKHDLSNQRYANLSKGYQALVRVALAIAAQTPYILLDEPFDGLDVIIRKQIVSLVIDTVAAGKRSVMIASHALAELDGLADRILMLKDTRLVEDVTLEDLRQQAVKLQLVFPDKTLPAVVKTKGRILSVQGRVVTVLFTNYSPALQQAITQAHPVLNETLPVMLEDLFVSELRKGEAHGTD